MESVSVPKHNRNGRFTTKLVTHGFVRDSSMTGASKAVVRQKDGTKHRFDRMNNLITGFYADLGGVMSLQRELAKMQRHMALTALRMLSSRKIQHMIRRWLSRRRLWMLRTARFIRDRIRFRMYYKRRVRAACKMAMRMLMFLARKVFKIHMHRKQSAIRIQKLFRKGQMCYQVRLRCTILGKVAVLLKHFELFGKCRAIMYMRREEVKRVQHEEQAQYAQLLAEEQARAARAAQKAIDDKVEAETKAIEARSAARAKLEQAMRKQRGAAPALINSVVTAAVSKPGPDTTPPGNSNKVQQKPLKSENTISAETDVASNSMAVVEVTEAQRGDDNAPMSVGQRPLDPTAVLLAHSKGVTAGQASVHAMHLYIENRYGSVYGGFYGEYCCLQENRENSFAAVRFRFMLRCLRKRRLKALAGPYAKTFFYMLAHLHNSPTERRPNRASQWLEASVKRHAVQRTLRLTQAQNPGGVGGGGGKLGTLLMGSFRRTRGAMVTTIAVPTAGTSDPTSAPAPAPGAVPGAATVDKAEQEEAVDTFLTTLPSSEVPFRGPPSASITTSTKQPFPTSRARFSSASPPKPLQEQVPTIPTYTIDNFPPGFLTGSYRPRTFAELVLILCDMRAAAIKTPSLVDDSEPPSPVKVASTTRTAASKHVGAVAALMKARGGKETSATATSSTALPVGNVGSNGTSSRMGMAAAVAVQKAITATARPAARATPLAASDKSTKHSAPVPAATPAAQTTIAAPQGQAAQYSTPEKVRPDQAPSKSKTPEVSSPTLPPAQALVSSAAASTAIVTAPTTSPPNNAQTLGNPFLTLPAAAIMANAVDIAYTADPVTQPAEMLTDPFVPTGAPAAASVPAQLRAMSRVMRPSRAIITTPPFVPAPYPSAQPVTPERSAVRRPSRPFVSSAGEAESGGREDGLGMGIGMSMGIGMGMGREEGNEDRYVMPAMQSMAPSAIIAAARESIRLAEETGPASSGGGRAPARHTLVRK